MHNGFEDHADCEDDTGFECILVLKTIFSASSLQTRKLFDESRAFT